MIYVFLANGFEEIEGLTVIDILRRCKLDVLTVGIGSEFITGSHKISILADKIDEGIELGNDTDLIVLPGGMPGTLNLERSQIVQDAIDFCILNNKLIGAICAAPSILGHKGLLKGKNAVCFEGFENELYGANILKDAVCVDGNIITSRSAGTAMEFSLKLIEKLISEERSELLGASLLWKKI